jgi:DNA polymerase III psi subunit
MLSQLTTDEQALRLFFTDDIYLVSEPQALQESPAQEQIEQKKEEVPLPILSEAPATVYKFLGNNKRNILILVNDAQNEVSDEKGRELLRKIVKSVNLTAGDFALLNYAAYKNTSMEQLQLHFSCVVVFAFGVSAVELGLNDQPQNSIISHGAVRMIFSAELRQLEQDPGAKKSLWGSLQQLGL